MVIEVDVTSYTDINDYLPYKVLEVWLVRNQVVIYQLQGDRYIQNNTSRYFPNINGSELILECYQIAKQRNTSATIREVRQKLTSEKSILPRKYK